MKIAGEKRKADRVANAISSIDVVLDLSSHPKDEDGTSGPYYLILMLISNSRVD